MSRSRTGAVGLAGSARELPTGADAVGEVDRDAPLSVAVHFRRRGAPPPPPGSARDLARLEHRMTRAALARERKRTHARAAARLEAFARAHGIAVRDVDCSRRRMVFEAPAGRLMEMFGAQLRIYDDGSRRFRARTGDLRIPREIAPWTRAVTGFDQRPLALRGGAGNAANGLWPTEVARLYGIPLDRDVSRQCIGIIAMGGGYQPSDLAAALSKMGRQPPVVIDQPVGGVSNAFDGGSDADQEIALDLQVAAGLLPGARIVVYFTGNTAEALADAIDQAVRDDVNKPQVLSVSWGAPEFFWTAPRREVVSAALCDAARLGVSVVTASGDQLATSGLADGKAHVWFPASSPYVLGCGGTAVTLAGSAIGSEAVWKEGALGTGGGISDNYPVPDFQVALASLPPSVNDGHKGRGVPDVAALAASSPGYRIMVGGVEMARDGTSAATPLWAALLAIANAERATPLGLVAPQLYRATAALRPITSGDNRVGPVGYAASAPWNACTGLGVPRGEEIVAALGAVPMA
jgi:kumamolisin